MLSPTLLTELTRDDVVTGTAWVESRHHGHLVLVGPEGRTLALGDPDRVTYLRSTLKPFQTRACLDLLADAGVDLGLDSSDLAISWASHRGEARHVSAVRSLLRRGGLDETALTCPPDRDAAREESSPRPVLHNCSGKHALFAVTGAALGIPKEERLAIDGRLQRPVIDHVRGLLGEVTAIAVDGCGAPAIAAPLRTLADAFRLLIDEPGHAAVARAGLTWPGLIGGVGRFESAMLEHGVVAKLGAEGVYGLAFTTSSGTWGLGVKAEDGHPRGAATAALAVLEELGVVETGAWSERAPQGGGRDAGTVRAAAGVRAAARTWAAEIAA